MLDAQIRLFVAAHARDRIFVHAGVVAREGRALVIPGESFSGKTTLVRRPGGAGRNLLLRRVRGPRRRGPSASLSAPAVDPRGRLESHAGTNVGESAAWPPWTAPRWRRVVVTRYRPGAEWRPTRLSRARECWRCSANTVPAQRAPGGIAAGGDAERSPEPSCSRATEGRRACRGGVDARGFCRAPPLAQTTSSSSARHAQI